MSSSSPIVRVRKNVRKLGAPGDDLDWYGKAVAALRKLAIADTTSWRYQAAVHGYPGHGTDPFRISGETLPSASDQKRFWDQCQHQTWFFLPWHRGYLACFEEIVAATVVNLGGPPGWALPYWNYSEAGQVSARNLPTAFLNQFLADGSDNPLWVSGRALAVPADQLPSTAVSLGCLKETIFSSTVLGAPPGFGGPTTGFSHFGGTSGALENTPHNVVHSYFASLMADPDTAALDPIFWLHHSNVDRLWEVWRSRNPAFVNPAVATWLSGTSFELHDSLGGVVSFNSGQMVDTHKVRHGYEYDDISDPYAAVATVASLAMSASSPSPATVQLVGSSRTSIALSDAVTTEAVEFDQPSVDNVTFALSGTRDPKAYLNIENVTGTKVYGVYNVYVAAPGSDKDPQFAGHLSTFGVKNASDPKKAHGGSGITTVLDITPLVDHLRQDNWDGRNLTVTFVHQGLPGSAVPSGGDLRVGRISVYHG